MSSSQEQGSIGVLEVLIIAGFTAFFTWYFTIVVGYPIFFPTGAFEHAPRITQLMSFVGMLAGSFFALYKPRSYDRSAYRPVKTVCWAIVSCVIPLLVMLETAGISAPFPAIALIMGATGFGAGYFMTGWENLASRDRMTDELVSIGMVMIVALALFLVISLFMTPLAQGAMGIIMALVGAVLFYGVGKRREIKPAKSARKGARKEAKDDGSEEAEGEDDFRGTFNNKLDLLLAITNIPLGFGLAVLYLFEPLYFYIAIAVALVALLLFVVIVRVAKLKLTFVNLLRISICASVVALISLGIQSSLSLVCSIVLFAVWLVLRLAHSVIILRLTSVQKVPPVYLAVRAKQPGYIGFIAGFVVAIVVLAFTDYRPAIANAGLVITAVLVIGSFVLMPFSESYSKQLAAVPVVVDSAVATAEDIEHAKCAELAKRFNLSPREEEILFFIVRGRNAKFIAEKLVISESTAKTHIHNIYKKSGIHSQQKFIDIMDELV